MVRIEPVSRLLADGLEDLTYQHWEEVEYPQTGLPLAVDWPAVLEMEKAGTFVGFSARRDGELVGYSGFIILKSLHFALTQALNDVIFTTAETRGHVGCALVREAELLLAARGVSRILYGSKVPPILNGQRGRDRVGELLRRMGYEHIENMHAKMIGAAHVQRRRESPEGV